MKKLPRTDLCHVGNSMNDIATSVSQVCWLSGEQEARERVASHTNPEARNRD